MPLVINHLTNMSSSSASQGLVSSMAAYNNGYYPLDHLHHHTLPVFNADMSTSLGTMDHDLICGGGGSSDGDCGMVHTPPMMFSPYHSEDNLTGYLQDALVEFTSRSKRRRLQLVYNDEPSSSSYYNNLDKFSYWSNSNCISMGDLTGDLSWMMMMDQDNCHDISTSDEHMSNSVAGDEANMLSSCSYEMKVSLEAISTMDEPISSSCSDKSMPSPSLVPTTSLGNGVAKNQASVQRVAVAATKKIVYPFALVKPGGVEGDMTINDINERILMPPARPVRHPVGDFACRPCLSPQGPGLSGKEVVAFTKIQTQGRGTITIIRTRG